MSTVPPCALSVGFFTLVLSLFYGGGLDATYEESCVGCLEKIVEKA